MAVLILPLQLTKDAILTQRSGFPSSFSSYFNSAVMLKSLYGWCSTFLIILFILIVLKFGKPGHLYQIKSTILLKVFFEPLKEALGGKL